MSENTNTKTEHIQYGDTVEKVFNKMNNAFDRVDESIEKADNVDKALLDAKTNGVTGETHETLGGRLDADSQLIKDLDEKVKKDVSSLKGSVDKTVQAINDRVNNLITQNNPTEGNSELQDIRLGADGVTYPSAGEAVRQQMKKIKDVATNIPNNSITPSKIKGSVFEYTGCNYIDKYACIDGYYINASGEEVENAGYRMTEKIYVGDQKYYSIDKLSWDGNSYIAFYSDDDTCLSAVKYGQTNFRTNGEIPSRTKYIKAGFPLIKDKYAFLILSTKSISIGTDFFKIPGVGEYVGNGTGDVSIGSEFTSLLKDIPISSLKDANKEYYNLFSGVQDESSGFYYLPIRSQYVIYATSGGWSNGQFMIKAAYKDGTVKSIFSTFQDTTTLKETNTVDIDNAVAVYITTVVSETVLNGVMISTRDDLKEYHPYGESYFNPSEQMKVLVQSAAQEDIVKNYGSGVLLGIGDSYMQNNPALAAIAAKHNLVCDNRGMASSSISGDEAQTVGLYPFWSRINTAVGEYTTGKTIDDAVYHCEDVKLIVFMGGANDGWIDYRRGAGKTETDTNTIYGALNSCFSTLLGNFPNADIIVILQPVNYNVSSSGWDEEMAKGYGFESLAAAQKFSDYQLGQYAMHTKESIVKEMAEMYGLNIVDCCFNWYSVLNPNDREKYWKTDKLHMTSYGNDEIYKVALEKAINNLNITRN